MPGTHKKLPGGRLIGMLEVTGMIGPFGWHAGSSLWHVGVVELVVSDHAQPEL